jgi:hypothetical protein
MSVHEDLLDYLVEKASPEMILAFELPLATQERENVLREKHRNQELNASEAQELAELMETEALLAALQARALEHREILENFKQGWKDMKEGLTHPLSELWNENDGE